MLNPLIIDDAFGRMAAAYYRRLNSKPVSAELTMVLDDPLSIPQTSLDTTLQAILTSRPCKTAAFLEGEGHGEFCHR